MPAEVVLSFTLRPGAVYLLRHDAFPDNHHFFVVLNNSVSPGDMLYLACASSQVTKRIEWVKRRKITTETLVIVESSQCDFVTKQTVFDCNTVHEVAYEVLKEKLDNHEIPSVNTIDKVILTQLRKAVHKSPMVSRKIKNMV